MIAREEIKETLVRRFGKVLKQGLEPDWARFSDDSLVFQFAYSFCCKGPLLPAKMLLIIYTLRSAQRPLLYAQVIVENGFVVPKNFRKRNEAGFYGFLNSLNSRGDGMWIAVSDTIACSGRACDVSQSSMRFYFGSMLCSINTANELILQVETRWANTSQTFFSWAIQDEIYEKAHGAMVKEEQLTAHYGEIDRQDTFWMRCEVVAGLCDLGCKKISYTESVGTAVVQFKHENKDKKRNRLIRNLPMTIRISPLCLTLDQYITDEEQNKFRLFIGEEEQHIARIITDVNNRLDVGCFIYNTGKKQVLLRVKWAYHFQQRSEWRKYVKEAVTHCFQTFVNNVPKMMRRLRDCLQFQELAEVEALRRSLSEAEECNTEDVSTLASATAAILDSFDHSAIPQLCSTLPEEAKEFFCLDPQQLSGSWKPWTKVEDSPQLLWSVIDTFVRLRRAGIEFRVPPFASCIANDAGKLLLLPSFPTETMNFASPNLTDADYAQHISAQVMNYLQTEVKCPVYSEFMSQSLQELAEIHPGQMRFPLLQKQHFIGRGAFGHVYYNVMGSFPVAIKVIAPRTDDPDRAFRDMCKELQRLQACPHPSIVRAYGYLKTSKGPALVTEFCKDGTLKSYITSRELTLQQRIQILIYIAEALVFMHAKQLCHFDLKPINVLFGQDGRPKLCDFGLARFVSPDAPAKKAGCTKRYASPEQLLGHPCSKPADVWGFSIVAYFVLHGSHPFPEFNNSGDVDASAISSMQSGVAALASIRTRDLVSTRLLSLISTGLRFEASQRPTMIEVLNELRAVALVVGR